MKITVIGPGRWGSFIAWYLDKIGKKVSLYGRENSKKMKDFLFYRKNSFLTLPKSINLTTDLKESLSDIDVLVISVGVQNLRCLLKEIKEKINLNVPIILCMKGIEVSTGMLPTEIVKDVLGFDKEVLVWIGPGHVEDFTKGIPNCMVIDSSNRDLVKKFVESFSSDLIRFYFGTDLIGNEIGAASKNVVGIAAGILDGLNLSSLKGALMARATREISRLIKAMNGDETLAYGLCHLGDYEATVFSKHSNNRKFGENFAKGESFTKLAEGFYTTKALVFLSKKYKVELPITKAVYNVLYENKNIKDEINLLFKRSLKDEF